MIMSWKKLKSKSRPGCYYYYNTATEESTWTNPHDHTHKGHSSSSSSTSSSISTHQKQSTHKKQSSASSSKTSSRRQVVVVEEDMECERWGDDEEVSMDVDLTVEQEIQLLHEISHTRNNLHLSSRLPGLQLSNSPVYTEMLYIVLDTNVLLSHLHFLVELKDYAIKSVGRPILILPWIVMQELDSLKTSCRGNISRQARAAIAFLHNCFEAGHPRVRGQTMNEVQTELDNIAISNNDDRILHCCLLYQEKVKGHGGVVVLFSNDIQLCSKAMVNQIQALNRKTLLSELRVLCRSMHQGTPTSYTHTSEFSSLVSQEVKSVGNNCLTDDILCESESVVRDGLSTMVIVEMEIAFDTLWSTVVAIKPPWTLKDLIHILKKHWIAVFGQVVERCYGQDSLKKLTHHVKTRQNMIPKWSDVENFISYSVLLLKAFPKRPNYRNVQSYSLACLDVLSRKLNEMGSKSLSPSINLPTPPTTPITTPTSTFPQDIVVSHENHVTMPALSASHEVSPAASALLPSSEPTVSLTTLTLTEIGALTRSVPSSPQDQLPWTLNIVLEITKHCLSRIAGSLASDQSIYVRSEASLFISALGNMLENVTVSMHQLLQNPLDISSLRDFRASLDTFLLTCLQLSCPLSLETVFTNVPLQLELIVQAVSEYSSALDTLRLLTQQYSLSL